MSLINEALKKAQGDRPSVNPNLPPPVEPGIPQQSPPSKGKGRRYLWGFILSVLIVGLFTTTLSTFLIYQIVGEEDDKTERAEQNRLETVERNAQELLGVLETATEEAPAEPVIEIETQQQATGQTDLAETPVPLAVGEKTATIPAPEVTPAEPVTASQTPSHASPPPAPQGMEVTEAPATQPPPASQPVLDEIPAPTVPIMVPQPIPASPVENPAIWGRLQNIEIRGIMSGGTKVMIFDADNNKTKTYRPDDLFDGTLSLRVASINSGAIIFEDNGGFRYTKTF